MSHYRVIDVRIWNDERFRAMSDDAKLVFLFLLSHPFMTPLGAMRATPQGLAAELGWAELRFTKALRESVEPGMVELNISACYIGLPKFLKYNEPNGPNSVVKAWLASIDTIPECPEKRDLILRCRKYLDGKSSKFRDRLPVDVWEAFSDVMPEVDAPADAGVPAAETALPLPTKPEPDRSARPRPAPDPPGFETWWAAYPRKTARADALKAWRALDPAEALQAQMRTAVEHQRTSPQWMKDGGEFIPYPATWIRDRRWEDQVDAVPVKPAGPEYQLHWTCQACGEVHRTPRAEKGRCPKAVGA